MILLVDQAAAPIFVEKQTSLILANQKDFLSFH